ncbi:uncharacterized protein isoform X2 [Choristoneura fumiferana]|uniref:uncharacterized protein isoform X2 n=1 Tax=Choristoneura fumiferana TaxID=7141 RepID=UPI003D156C20
MYRLMWKWRSAGLHKCKPRWVTCIAFAVAMLIITAVAVTTGVFIGYTYCYLEHRSEALKGNISHPRNVQIVRIPMPEQPTPYNKTINGALSSNYIISKILRISGVLVDGEIPAPRSDPDEELDSTNSLR